MNSSSSSILSTMLSTEEANFVDFQELQPLHCQKDALTDFFGWILQIILAGIAFSCLIGMFKTQLCWHIFLSLIYCLQLNDTASPFIDEGHGTFGGWTQANKALDQFLFT